MKTWQVLLLLTPSAGAQSTWYVDAAGTAPGDGSQGNPYTSIQYAIDQVTTLSGDTLLVASGTYLESLDLGAKELTIDGQGPTAAIVDAGGVGSAVRIAGGQSATTLRDLEITGGTGSLSNGWQRGGGLFVQGSSVTLDEVVVRDNTANDGGGIALIDTAQLTMTGGSLMDCTAQGGFLGGGGLFVDSTSSAQIDDVDFLRNLAGLDFSATNSGGGILSQAPFANLTVSDSLFHDNGSDIWNIGFSTLYEGGAARALGLFVNCVFTENDGQLGGALYGGNSEGCTFERNEAYADGSGDGGAVHGGTHYDGIFRENIANGLGGAATNAQLFDCVVVDNVNYGQGFGPTIGFGAGLYGGTAVRTHFEGNREMSDTSKGGAASNSVLSDCTLIGNEAQDGGATFRCRLDHCTVFGNEGRGTIGGCLQSSGSNELTSCIVVGNTPGQLDATSVASWSAIEGGWPGFGNTAADPSFWSVVQPDLHLRAGSPCIATGELNTDMGALPYDTNYIAESGTYCVGKETSAGCTPQIGFAGVPSLSLPGTFDVLANDVMGNTPGILFWGGAPQAAPFMGGTLCVAAPQTRSTVLFSTGTNGQCDGSFSYSMDAAFFGGLGLAAGDALYTQYWFRDPQQSDGTGIGLSDALEIIVRP